MLLLANHITLFLVTLSNLVMHSHAALPLRLLTHNIRYATTSPFTGEKLWVDRRPLIVNEIKYNTLYNPESFVCLQEVLNNQLVDIMSDLGSAWSYIGVGRDDGKTKGEYSPIIFRKGVWNVESWKTVWLNEDGSVGKKGWDAGSVRIVTIGHFKHVESKKRVLGMCTHFDNAGAVSRRESAKILSKLVDAESAMNGSIVPYFLGGDLNSEMSGEAYQMLNSKNSPLRDAREVAGWKQGNQYTFTGFKDEKDVIDFVFVGPRNGSEWSVEGYSVLPNRFDDGVFNSDHRAVVVDTVLHI
ncbi:Endonuclease/exonuclease/phosphatase [Phaeosphaeria sp. MPI-PUGE-AT-0046c]|nr:Endonuclease/exonuclease/phosphatase [Phaeosphaeria sp. MPI-PUGE-AT-0046c]